MLRDRITDFLYTLSSNILCSKGGILLGRVTGKGRAQEITVGSGLLFVGTTLTSSSVPIQDGQLTIPKTAGLQAALDGKSSLSAVADIQLQVNQKTPLPLVMASPPVSEVLGYATASIVFSGNPLGGDSFTINGTIYTFYRGLAPFSPRDITPPMPENANNWAAAATYAINNWRLGGPDANVTASVIGATVMLTARSRGVAGNSITLSKASAVLAISGGTLTGGIPPISGTPGKAGQTAVVTVGELKTIYTCVTENPLKWNESFSERNLGANVATALAKPTGTAGSFRQNINFVFEGDSVFTSDWDTVNTPLMGLKTSVPSQFLQICDLASGSIVNHAVSGQTVLQMVAQYPTQAKLQSPNTTGIPSWFILNGGINDIASGNTAEAIYANLKNLWAAARADGFQVCATTQHGWTTDQVYEQKRRDLNNLILSDSKLYNALARFDISLKGYRNDQYFDTVHANEIGRKILALSLIAAIKGNSFEVLDYTSARTASAVGPVAPGAAYAVPLNVFSNAGGNWINSNSFRCQAKGKYLVCANILVVAGAMNSSDTVLGRIYINNVSMLRCSQYGGLSGTNIPLSISGFGIVEANIGDLIAFKIESAGPTLSILSVPENCWMQVYQLPSAE